MIQPEPSPPASRVLAATFVVRVWEEAQVYRGQIVHVQTGATTFFTEAERMLAFIAEHGAIHFSRKEVNPNAVPDHADAQSGKLPD